MNEEQDQTPNISEMEMKMPEGTQQSATPKALSPAVLGPILAILIVILILILIGLYLWGSTFKDDAPAPIAPVAERPTPAENNEPESNTADAQVQALETVSTSDELSAIDADLESTNLDQLDTELNAIDAELNSALQ